MTSAARTTLATSREPFPPTDARALEELLQLVAAAAHRFVETPLERATFLEQTADAFLDSVNRRLEQLGDVRQRALFVRVYLVRAGPGHRLDAPHAGRDAGLGDDLADADLRRVA